MKKTTIGYALTGSFCTFEKSLSAIEKLVEKGYEVIPVMSFNAYSIDTRFGKADDFKNKIKALTGNDIIATIPDAEPIGPKKLFDLLIISPCTGNTLGKLANGIYDTPVTLAFKSHLRNSRPVLIGVSSNDALSMTAGNIGALLKNKNIYFIPVSQDSPINKPHSMVCHFEKTTEAAEKALSGEQLQPIIG